MSHPYVVFSSQMRVPFKRPAEDPISLRFDRECRNFSWIHGKKEVHFRSEEARFIKTENDNLYFEVRGETLTFPTWVTAAGNIRTMFHLKGGGEFVFLDLLSALTKIQMTLKIRFAPKLEVRAMDLYDGKPRPYNRIF